MIDLESKRQEIISAATEIFEKIVGLPKSVRPDDKERTGIQVLVRCPGTRNLVFESIKEPSEAAKFFAAEKAVRSDLSSDMASQNTANEKEMKFAGSVTVDLDDRVTGYLDEGYLQASVSGLKAEEDVFIAVSLIAKILDCPFVVVYENIISHDGELPLCFYDKAHYLNKYLREVL